MQDQPGPEANAPGPAASPPCADAAEIARCLEVLHPSGAVFEIRIPDPKRGPARLNPRDTYHGYFDSPLAAARAVERLSGADAQGVYASLNAVNPAMLARRANRLAGETKKGTLTADSQIVRRTALAFDIDARTPVKQISSTDAERDAARAAAARLRAYLTDQGWPAPRIDGMSGNGAQLIYGIDLANDAAATALISGVLAAAACLLDSPEVEVDQSVANASRVIKLFGTVAAKGDDVPERPWRRATAAYQPDAPAVTRDQLEALAGQHTASDPAMADDAAAVFQSPRGRSWTVAEKLDTAGIDYTITHKAYGVVYALSRCLTSTEHVDGACIGEMANGALWYRCHHASCAGKAWRDVRSVLGLDSAPDGGTTPAGSDGGSSDRGPASGAVGSPPVRGEARATPWPEPLAPEAFHGLAGEIVRAVEPYSEADPVALLAHCLTGVGALVGPDVHAVAGDAYHPARLNAVCVGQSSKGRKGSAARPIERLLGFVDPSFVPGRVVEGLSSGEGLIWAVRDPIQRYERIGQGPNRRSELVEIDPGVEDKRLWVLEAEFASVLRVIQRDGNTLSALVRRAWDSGDLRTLTKNSPAVATGAHISIVGHVTRDELLRYLDRTELASGFANRFLWFAVRRARLLPDGAEVPRQLLERLAAQVRRVADWAGTDRVLVREREASALWHDVYPMLVRDQAGLFGAATSRAEAQVLRLSVIYAVLDCAEAIRAEHLLAALAVWRHAEQSARWIFDDSLGDPTADTILAALRRSGPLSRNDIVNLFGRNLSQARIDRALGLLLAAGLVCCAQDRDTGGRPREVWHAA